MNLPTGWFLSLRTILLLLPILLSAGCNTNSNSVDPSENVVELSRHYQQHSDYQSLVSLLPYLNTLTMHRSEIEQLLGIPAYCPRIDTCWYSTEKSVPAMCPEGSEMEDNTCRRLASGQEIEPLKFRLVLMVTYELSDSGAVATKASDKLIRFELRPVGE
jgi:hypothetical protein